MSASKSDLSHILTPQSPFGPASADEIPAGLPATALFDSQNEIDNVVKKTAPVFLIGRRGSGKTAFLRATMESSQHAVPLNAAELISAVARVIRSLRLEHSGTFAERLVPVWEAAFIAAICGELSSPHGQYQQDSPPISIFGHLARVSPDGAATDAATKFLQEVRTQAETHGDYASISTFLDEVTMNGVPLWVARQQVTQLAQREGWRAAVALDSLDQYNGILYGGSALATPEAFALQGLFRAASKTGRRDNLLYRVRVSFPAELWHFYSRLSSNPLKDFDNSILLHWDNSELLRIAGQRLRRYLEFNDPAEYRRLTLAGSQRNRWPHALLHRYMPTYLENSFGIEEPTIAYILRHTQLLPRHLLTILNRIFRDKSPLTPQCISPNDIRRGVEEAEEIISPAVISAYEIPYPHLSSICDDLIPTLRLSTLLPGLEESIKRTNGRGMHDDEILSMLIEVGALGRWTEDTRIYRKADFEYLHISRMLVSDADTLCIHPLFARHFQSMDAVQTTAKPDLIQPLGSDPTSDVDFHRYVHMTSS